MAIINRVKDAFKRKKARDFAQELSNQFFLSPLCSDYENVFAQVRPLIDEMKCVMPYGVTERGTKLKIDKTPELYWLQNPNDEMGWAEFADVMFATWLTEDELDLHLWRDERGRVIGYTILPPECRIYLGYGRWEWQVITTEGIKILEEDEVMRLRFSRSPRNIQKGVSPASSVRVWAQIDDLISQYQRAYFENGAIPATITFITASTYEKYDKTRKELENKLKGAHNRNKTVYAWRQFDNDSGQSVDQIEVKTIQGNNSTLAIKEIVDIVNDRLNKSIGVSNFILGDDSSAKYDNAELSDHQFTKRRVYPALMSFWNQFQHELERLLGGLGYAISFDLEIPELTARAKDKAEIARIRGESLVNLIEAGATGDNAVKALGLCDDWLGVARDIYAKSLILPTEPIAIDYEKPKAITATVDKTSQKKDLDVVYGHKCSCHKDKLPPMTSDERKLYNQLVELAGTIFAGGKYNIDEVVDEMIETLSADALQGKKTASKALALLVDDNISAEILKTLRSGDIYVSGALKGRITNRARQLATGYVEHTSKAIQEVLAGSEGLTANEIKERLRQAMPAERAELIARNETLYAIRSGRLEQDEALAEKYGLNVRLVWRTSGDADVCDICAGMEGETVELGKAFNDTVELADGETATWEQSSWNDDGRIPDAHVNCRCYFEEELV